MYMCSHLKHDYNISVLIFQALQYCEAISRVILNSPTLFQPILVKLVNEVITFKFKN